MTQLEDHERAEAPNGMPWQHFTLTLGGTDRGPFETFNDEQRRYFEGLGEMGWEMVGLSTLANGWLMVAFKRPWPSNPQGREPAHPGVYL